MRVIVTSDWQVEYANLDQSEKAWNQIIEIVRRQNLEAIILAGDLKHSYNPIDIRVIKFWRKAISRAKYNDIRVIILLGNHDREGLYTDAKNWLSILREFGAEVFDKPGICELTDGKIAMLPFTTKKSVLRERAKQLSEKKWNKNRDILLFHDDVQECKYNKLGTNSQSKLKFIELYPQNYLACLGGHIHLPQEVGKNGYYIGSPFCMDWGEVNQQKRFIIVTDNIISSISSDIPNWYDPSLPGYKKPKDFRGARVRLHQAVAIGEKYSRIIDKAQRIAERTYSGAIVKIVPEFEDQVQQETKININDSDDKKIEQYVEQTVPDKLEKVKHKIVGYLTGKLRQSEGLRRHGSQTLKFISVKGKNVLSFEKVGCVLEKQGLVLIEGTNKDWSNQSNGSGKTNYAQLISVSLFGTTFKGQKFDKWARRQTKDRAEIELKLTNESGHDIRIIRCRRPNWIQLLVNKVDHSSGLNKNKDEGTQARIESITGLTWQTLANSIYIDKSVAHSFISGSKIDRTNLLYKFQNLERFERALKLIKKSEQRLATAQEQSTKAIEMLQWKYKELKTLIKADELTNKIDVEEKQKTYNKRLSLWKDLHSEKKRLETKARHTYRRNKPKYSKVSKYIVSIEQQIEEYKRRLWKFEQRIQSVENLITTGKCPTCNTELFTKTFKENKAKAKRNLKKTTIRLNALDKERRKHNERCALYEGEIDKSSIEASTAASKADTEREYLRSIKHEIEEDKSKRNSKIKQLKVDYKKNKLELAEWIEYKKDILNKEELFYKFCLKAFSRDGLPAFINNQLCPVLNKASEYYSDLFCDKEILVQFLIEEGNLIPSVTTIHGGSGTLDQSAGESAMAGLITSFALKEIAPKTNILIIDEPEAGLSPENVTRFARKLLEIKKRFETIFVVTHSQILLSELSNEKVVKIVKKDKISKVIQ